MESLVLFLDEIYFSLDLFFPPVLVGHLSALVLSFEFSNLFELCLFLYFKDGLLACFVEKHIQDWLNFSVEVKEVIVANLSLSVEASLLWHVLGRGRLGQEIVSLRFYIDLFRNNSVLLCQEKSQVDLDTSLRKGTQVIDTCV